MTVKLARGTTCCGVQELGGIGMYDTPQKCVVRVYKDGLQSSRGAFYFFTDRVSYGRGVALAKYIKENDLGDLIETKAVENPNSRSKIKVWVWTREPDKLQAWFDKNASAEDKELVEGWKEGNRKGIFINL